MFEEESRDTYGSGKDTNMGAEERLAAKLSESKTLLPPPPDPKGVYRPLVIVGNLVYLSGHLPVRPSGRIGDRPAGAEVTIEAGYEAARLAGLGILASLRKQFGTLDRIRRVVKILGVVNSTPEFTHLPAVINGCSDVSARFSARRPASAPACPCRATLPLGVAVEIEAIFELEA